jgi:YegS/Rv2252/BmrU family lipid kinase
MSDEMAPSFRQVAIIENPGSGQPSARRKAALAKALLALGRAGVDVLHLTIHGEGSGRVLARQAIAAGCDAILVCGGDGTVHEVLQALVGTPVALGVLPMGTANALASDLGLPRSPQKAIDLLLASRPVQVPVGRVVFNGADGAATSRYFTVAAGVGADALLMARMDPALKRRLGYALYMIEAFRIWVSHRFPLFQVEIERADGTRRTIEVSQLLAVRVRSFGGALGRFAPGASVQSNSLSIIAFKTRSRVKYVRFLMAVVAGRHTFSSHVELVTAMSAECRPLRDTDIYAETDGEVLGLLPIRIEISTEKLTLLVPLHARP